MENNSIEKEDRYQPQPSLNGQNMDREDSGDPYTDDQIPIDEREEESEEKKAVWPFSHLHQQISDLPDGGKDDTDITDGSEDKSKSTDEAPAKDRITSIRPLKGK